MLVDFVLNNLEQNSSVFPTWAGSMLPVSGWTWWALGMCTEKLHDYQHYEWWGRSRKFPETRGNSAVLSVFLPWRQSRSRNSLHKEGTSVQPCVVGDFLSHWFIQQLSPWKDFLFPPMLEMFPVEVSTSRKKPRRNNSHMGEADMAQDLQGHHAASEGQAGCIWGSQRCVSLQGGQLSQDIKASHCHNT